MPQLDDEDEKLVVLARAARARIDAAAGAAVRDEDGRTYAAATVELPSLQLTALQLAVAQAVAAGAAELEAAAIVCDDGGDASGVAAVQDLTPQAPIYLVSTDGISQVDA